MLLELLESLQKSGYEFLPVIESFGCGRGGTPLLILHHVEGCVLRELQEPERDTALIVARKLMVAIECLHEQQLSNIDIHPENVRYSAVR